MSGSGPEAAERAVAAEATAPSAATDASPEPVADAPQRRLFEGPREAFGLLTALPVSASAEQTDGSSGVAYYPWVGWALGLWGVLAAVLLRLLPGRGSELLQGLVVVAVWAGATRLLHWDGLADTADGLLGGRGAARRLEIMRDSSVGAFGAASIVLVLLAQASAVGELVWFGVIWPVLAAPVLARASASVAVWSLPAARPDGLGKRASRRPTLRGVLVVAAALVLLVWAAGPAAPGLVAACLVTGLVLGLVLPRWFASFVGGITGDILGATILLVETGVLVAAALTL